MACTFFSFVLLLFAKVPLDDVFHRLAPLLGGGVWTQQVVRPPRRVEEEDAEIFDLHPDVFGQRHLALEDLAVRVDIVEVGFSLALRQQEHSAPSQQAFLLVQDTYNFHQIIVAPKSNRFQLSH